MSNPDKAKTDNLKRALDLWSAHQDLLRAHSVDGTSGMVERFVANQELLTTAEEFHAAVAPKIDSEPSAQRWGASAATCSA